MTAARLWMLHVTWVEDIKRLQYTVYGDRSSGAGEWSMSNPLLQQAATEYLANLNALLSEFVSIERLADDEWDSVSLNLKSVGEALFQQLLPFEVRRMIRLWDPGAHVTISTNEQWIPWELLHDGNGFLGERFALARVPRLSDRRLPSARANSHSEGTMSQMLNVVGGGLPKSDATRAVALGNNVTRVAVKVLVEPTAASLAKALSGVGAVHCTCHGILNPHLLQIAKDRSAALNLLPQTIAALPLEPDAFVFANACSSSLPVLAFGNFSSFAWEFYRAGARTFVGTLGVVPTAHAIEFAELFYSQLLPADASATVAEAMMAARKAASANRNPFWLFYTVFGDQHSPVFSRGNVTR